MLTRVGKNVTMPEMMVMAARLRPKMATISGVIATSGTERSTIASGMNTELAVRDR